MKPLVAIVGRPNVGKSTLFNRLVGEKRAIVLDTPGVTRDRMYGDAYWVGREFTVIDTGGFEPEAEAGIPAAMRRQAMLAVEQADVVVFVTDGREGLTLSDREVGQILRRASSRVLLAVNKIDAQRQLGEASDFWELGFEEVYPISAEHGRGVGNLLDAVLALFPEPEVEAPEEDEEEDFEVADDFFDNDEDIEADYGDGEVEAISGRADVDEDEEEEEILPAPKQIVTRVALIGRPNVGKSTLANRLLNDERMIVDSTAGTTRDAIDAPLTHNGVPYLLIDTAGLRRARGIDRLSSEGYSVVRTLRALDRCHVAVVLIDATEGVTDQDVRIIGLSQERGRALVLAVNKWDAIEKDAKTAKAFSEQIADKLPFASYAPVVFLSGLTGQRVNKLMEVVAKVRAAHRVRIGTGKLNRWLTEVVAKHHPPMVGARRVRLYYAAQVRTAPPTIMLSCNDPTAIHFSYQRYLVNQFREAFDVEGTPIRLAFRGKTNPYVDPQ